MGPLTLDDVPDLVVIQVYITSAFRAYRLADGYRARGAFVVLKPGFGVASATR